MSKYLFRFIFIGLFFLGFSFFLIIQNQAFASTSLASESSLFTSESSPFQQERQQIFKYTTKWIREKNSFILSLTLEPQEKNYTYAPRQANTYPTELKLVLPENSGNLESSEGPEGLKISENLKNNDKTPINTFSESPIFFPRGKLKADPLDPSQQVYVYDTVETLYLVFSEEEFKKLPLEAKLSFSFLACSDQRCMPVQENIALPSRKSITTQEQNKRSLLELLSNKKDFLTVPLDIQYGESFGFGFGLTSSDADEEFKQDSLSSSLESKTSKPTNTEKETGTLQNSHLGYNFSPRLLTESLAVSSLTKALIFGLIAGFILNFMPCVLPVLAMKVRAFMHTEQGDINNKEKKQKHYQSFREYNIFFAIGIITWFIFLGILLALLGMSWGQIFQSPSIIFGLMLFIFSLALSLLGVFHLPMLGMSLESSHKNSKVQAFLSGLLATLLATPCSGPLLGAVLGYSLTQKPFIALIIFMTMGIGMALPYLLFAINPHLSRFLPKAGTWLKEMENIMAFFLFATVLYLLSILPNDWLFSSLIILFITAFCAYIWGRFGSIHANFLRKSLLLGLSILLIATSSYYLLGTSKKNILWHNFTEKSFQESLGKSLMVVKFTADWCPTCKVLEYNVFTDDNMQKIQKNFEVEFIKVDMTRFNPSMQALQKSLNSVSIPLLAVFPKGELSHQPIIIRDIYTYNQLIEAIKLAVD